MGSVYTAMPLNAPASGGRISHIGIHRHARDNKETTRRVIQRVHVRENRRPSLGRCCSWSQDGHSRPRLVPLTHVSPELRKTLDRGQRTARAPCSRQGRVMLDVTCAHVQRVLSLRRVLVAVARPGLKRHNAPHIRHPRESFSDCASGARETRQRTTHT